MALWDLPLVGTGPIPKPQGWDGDHMELSPDDFIKKVNEIKKAQLCAYDKAIEIAIREGYHPAPGATSIYSSDRERIKSEIMAELGLKGDIKPKTISTLEDLRVSLREEETKLKEQFKNDEEKRARDIKEAAEKLVELKTNAGTNLNPDGSPKDPMLKKVYDLALVNFDKVIASKNDGIKWDHETIGTVGRVVTEFSDKIIAYLEKKGEREKVSDFIFQMGQIIQTLKNSGLKDIEAQLTVGNIIRIMELAKGVASPAPASKSISRDDLVKSLEDDFKKANQKLPPPPNATG